MDVALAHAETDSHKYIITTLYNISSEDNNSPSYDTTEQMRGYGWDITYLYSEGLAEWK